METLCPLFEFLIAWVFLWILHLACWHSFDQGLSLGFAGKDLLYLASATVILTGIFRVTKDFFTSNH